MKKLTVLGMGFCMVLALASCKSSESAYKKAYDKAKAEEQVESIATLPVDVTPVVTAPVEVKVEQATGVRQEKVTYVSGNEEMKEYNVVCGSFGLKANAEGLKNFLVDEGYNATIAFNADASMYRVIVDSFSDRASAERARDAFKAKYPNRDDFQKSWLLYRIY
ncbi:SPOR domain-containing protein [Bacteroides sp. OttesenSCG-928-D19]|nr:SPOR domain-containing protein [Bacteroides sp. OttesenSCG-928-N06]MDL2304790.1 SPOR domain-containing protein [Bacteroides sp. OttesenSCG-928-D19]